MQQQQQSKATWVAGMESMHSIFLCALVRAAGYVDELSWEVGMAGNCMLYQLIPRLQSKYRTLYHLAAR